MNDTEEFNWDEVKAHLEETIEAYQSIGVSGQMGLTITLYPLRSRYASGERTQELYEAMFEVE